MRPLDLQPSEIQGPCTYCGSTGTHATWCAAPVPLGRWTEQAMCVGVDMFPEKPHQTQLFALCRACPVQRQCAEYAIEARMDDGIWGGISPMDRRLIRRGVYTLEEKLGA